MSFRLVLIVIAAFLMGALGGLAFLKLRPAQLDAPGTQAAGKALIGGPFELVDQTGKTVTDKDYRGKFMLMFFGFIHCPDVCPAELQVMAAALDRLGGKADRVAPIFISVDPERDTPEKMAEYVRNFGPRFIGLTGSPQQISATAKAYRVYYSKIDDEKSAIKYTMDHSAIAYLMSPEGDYLAHFNYGAKPEDMAKTIEQKMN